ncbi:glycosyltransferase [Alicyclobacillus sp. SO9]|uniref:glycosyltransferase n=1 Tax=Alicyclobacillus sp. SO9 TaxID=2665646 RepID=UPI0018E83C32|nr:glycosyltransferase [Alicyclobacillus sp. SO9]QQE80325.1 glycosyltransferase [Alicyclobacillus sp. SO9]
MSDSFDLLHLMEQLNLNDSKDAYKNIYTLISNHKHQQAQPLIQAELKTSTFRPELLLTAGYVCEQLNNDQEAYEFYQDALLFLDSQQKEQLIENSPVLRQTDICPRRKIAFFVRPGLDNFLSPVIEHLSNTLPNTIRTKKFVIRDITVINSAMKWADICWFEWCDNLIAYASKQPMSMQKKIICRLHSYEAFTSYIFNVNWSSVDKVVFVGSHIRDYVLDKQPQLHTAKTVIIPNGIDLSKHSFADRKPGFNIAYVGYINHKKGPMLLLHGFKMLHDKDSRYQLHIAGAYQDIRYRLYFEQMIKEWDLEDSVHFDGWQNDIDHYLEDKNYIISASPLESQHLSIMEAMAKGIKPLVHHFYGAESVYDKSYIWSGIEDLIEMVTSKDYASEGYRTFIKEHYEFTNQMKKIGTEIEALLPVDTSEPSQNNPASPLTNGPLVTIGIINYNYSRFLDEVIPSALEQSYRNLEVLVVDDCSTDDSVQKIHGYMSKHPQVRGIFHAENCGTEAVAIREILSQAQGDYLIIVNADDFLPDHQVVERYMKVFSEDKHLDYIYGDLLLVGDASQITGHWTYRQYTDNEVVKYIFQRKGSGIIPMAGMFKLDFYRKHQYEWIIEEGNTNAGDTLNCLVNVNRGWRYKYVNVPILCHRRHQNNLTYNMTKRIKSVTSVMDYIVNNFDEKIYLPQVNWQALNKEQQRAAKHYFAGVSYWQMKIDYAKTPFVAALDSQAKTDCLEPLLSKAQYHFNLSLHHADDYQTQISQLLDQNVTT